MNGTIARTPALPRDSHDRAVYVWASGRYPDVQVTWDDPIAAFAAGKALAGIDYMNEMIAGRIAPPPIMRPATALTTGCRRRWKKSCATTAAASTS